MVQLSSLTRAVTTTLLTPLISSVVSPVVPTDNLSVHLDASNIGSLTLLPGNKVSQWNNIAPNTLGTNNATQGVSSAQPLYVASGVNGLPGIIADGLDDEMNFPDSTLPIGNSNYEYYCVVANNSTGSGLHAFVTAGIEGYSLQFLMRVLPGQIEETDWFFNVQIFSSIPYVVGEAHIYTSTYNGAIADTYYNDQAAGSQVPSGARNTQATNHAIMGQTLGPTNFKWPGEFKELLVYTEPLAALDRQKVWEHLANKWGITL